MRGDTQGDAGTRLTAWIPVGCYRFENRLATMQPGEREHGKASQLITDGVSVQNCAIINNLIQQVDVNKWRKHSADRDSTTMSRVQ